MKRFLNLVRKQSATNPITYHLSPITSRSVNLSEEFYEYFNVTKKESSNQ